MKWVRLDRYERSMVKLAAVYNGINIFLGQFCHALHKGSMSQCRLQPLGMLGGYAWVPEPLSIFAPFALGMAEVAW